MPDRVVDRLITLLDLNPTIAVVDLTGGAPEMHPGFPRLVVQARRRHLRVIDRCHLTILLESGYTDLPEFLAAEDVHLIASLPCYTAVNVDRQRGLGVFDGSIQALKRLNALGYGRDRSPRRLDLVYNPLGASLPPSQSALEELLRSAGVIQVTLIAVLSTPLPTRVAMRFEISFAPFAYARHGLLANLVTASLVTVDAVDGLPMSTTQVSAGGIMGIGAERGSLNWTTVHGIALAWILTLPAAAALGAAAYQVAQW